MRCFTNRIAKRHCRFAPAVIVAVSCRDAAALTPVWFEQWAVQYTKAFSTAHPAAVFELARRRVESHFTDTIRPGDLAQSLKCSTAALSRGFQQLTGLTLHKYQMRLRQRRALELMEARDQTIDAVPRRIGYAARKDLYRLLRRADLHVKPLMPPRPNSKRR
jgi:AraC-like DNA-binding protein